MRQINKVVMMLILVLVFASTVSATTCYVVSIHTTQTGQAIYRITCPEIVSQPNSFIDIKPTKEK